jgi:hypothetical protein
VRTGGERTRGQGARVTLVGTRTTLFVRSGTTAAAAAATATPALADAQCAAGDSTASSARLVAPLTTRAVARCGMRRRCTRSRARCPTAGCLCTTPTASKRLLALLARAPPSSESLARVHAGMFGAVVGGARTSAARRQPADCSCAHTCPHMPCRLVHTQRAQDPAQLLSLPPGQGQEGPRQPMQRLGAAAQAGLRVCTLDQRQAQHDSRAAF